MAISDTIKSLEYFADIDGFALDDGSIYIGEPGKDPRNYPAPIFWDSALTIPAVQPLKTVNGYISYPGAPAAVYIQDNYSILVLNKKGEQVFYVGSVQTLNSAFVGLNFAQISQIQNQGYVAYNTSGTAPAFSITTSPAYGPLAANQRVRVKWNQSSAAPTLNRDSIGAINVKVYSATGAKIPAQVFANCLNDLEYDGTDWVVLNPNVLQLAKDGQITIATPVTASGTAVNFTAIPATARRLTLMWEDLSTNGTDDVIVFIGDSGGNETTGYQGSVVRGAAQSGLGTGFNIDNGIASALAGRYGKLSLDLSIPTTNTWNGVGCNANTLVNQITFLAGKKSLSSTLDRITITTTGGVNIFDAGTVSLSYE